MATQSAANVNSPDTRDDDLGSAARARFRAASAGSQREGTDVHPASVGEPKRKLHAMEILDWVSSTVSSLPLPLIWGLAALFAFLENGLGLGFFVPGEMVIVILATAVSDLVSAGVLFAAVLAAGSAGDHV